MAFHSFDLALFPFSILSFIAEWEAARKQAEQNDAARKKKSHSAKSGALVDVPASADVAPAAAAAAEADADAEWEQFAASSTL